MSSVFATGKTAVGDQFLGREQIIRRIFKALYNDNHNIAMVGLPRIGKTSIACRVCERIEECIESTHEKTLLLMINLAAEMTFESAWCTIIHTLYEKTVELAVRHPQLEKEYRYFDENQPSDYQTVKIHAEKFLQRLKKLDIRTILIVDEFDASVVKFSGQRYYYEFFRDIASTASYAVTLMLISRQLIKRIEANAYGNSTLFGVMDAITIRAFDEAEDYPQYLKKLASNGYEITTAHQQQMEDIAGHNPYMLCILGNRLLEAIEEGKGIISPEDAYMAGKSDFLQYFEALMHQMENDKNLSHVQQIIIGPKYDVTKDDVDMLVEMGYLSMQPGNIYWSVISSEFSLYLLTKGQNKDIWKELMEAQRLLQERMKSNLPYLLGHHTHALSPTEFNTLMETAHVLDEPLYQSFVKKSKIHYNVDATYVDVASIENLAKVLERFWDNSEYGFRYSFDNQSFTSWRECFQRMNLSRNACAHGHTEYLSEEDIAKTNAFCQKLKEVLLT